ncbi:hypothetical protein TREAZ_2864 [Leadbettera azotonutricia ZAS-9]|uniref:Uncharacterized protein n=1 Tax=Leadbettera azotonutricia (strain ATCC BAA-888 / DSM 13862 / ZAS-9) TaxID=545695 RepID=F5YCE6_LEAAZ|nr:hypothetical protein TREAZ_2864 [Leadbettera azotonutricia ZAS-9]
MFNVFMGFSFIFLQTIMNNNYITAMPSRVKTPDSLAFNL